jgi:hypothetical protein
MKTFLKYAGIAVAAWAAVFALTTWAPTWAAKIGLARAPKAA